MAETKALDPVQLAFLGDALEGLNGTLDPVLVVVAFWGQQLDHRIGAGSGGTTEGRRGVINYLTDLITMGLEGDLARGKRLHRRARCAHHLGRLERRLESGLESRLGRDAGRTDRQGGRPCDLADRTACRFRRLLGNLSLIHISEPTRQAEIS